VTNRASDEFPIADLKIRRKTSCGENWKSKITEAASGRFDLSLLFCGFLSAPHQLSSGESLF